MNDQAIRTSNLDRLVEHIKSEGIEQAHREAALILAQAEEERSRILDEAQKQADALIEASAQKVLKAEQAMTQRLKMVGRDLVLSLEEELVKRLQSFLALKLAEPLNTADLKDFILALAQGFSGQGPLNLEVTLPPEVLTRFETSLIEAFKSSLAQDIKLKGDPKIGAGLLICEQGSDFFFDFSANRLAQWLAGHAGPRLKELFEQGEEPSP